MVPFFSTKGIGGNMKRRLLGLRIAAGLAAASAIGMGLLPVDASGASSSRALPRTAPGSPEAKSTSPVVAGYVGEPSSGIASVSSTFNVPKITCAIKTDAEVFYLGPFLSAPNVGLDDARASELLECNDGKATYDLEVSTHNGATSYSPNKPGDTVSASVAESNSGETTATATDITTGHSLTSEESTLSGANADTTYYEGLEAIPSLESAGNIPTFTKITFNYNQVNGQYLGEVGATVENLKQFSDEQVATSSLSTSSQSFVLTFKHNH
jgi:Peptidase A4 family